MSSFRHFSTSAYLKIVPNILLINKNRAGFTIQAILYELFHFSKINLGELKTI